MRVYSHLERELARVVVHAARVHERQRVAHRFSRQDLLAGDRANAAVRERRGDDGRRLGVHFRRTQLRGACAKTDRKNN